MSEKIDSKSTLLVDPGRTESWIDKRSKDLGNMLFRYIGQWLSLYVRIPILVILDILDLILIGILILSKIKWVGWIFKIVAAPVNGFQSFMTLGLLGEYGRLGLLENVSTHFIGGNFFKALIEVVPMALIGLYQAYKNKSVVLETKWSKDPSIRIFQFTMNAFVFWFIFDLVWWSVYNFEVVWFVLTIPYKFLWGAFLTILESVNILVSLIGFIL